ncbi:MAG TPA: GerMN domain-containing protein [Anaerolineales bacterium]
MHNPLRRANRLLVAILILPVLAGCGLGQVLKLDVGMTTPSTVPTKTALASLTPLQPGAPSNGAPIDSTSSSTPSAAQTEAANLSPATPPAAGSSPASLKIFLIAVDDNGKSGLAVGCGDSAVPSDIPASLPAGAQPPQAVRAALEALFSIHEQIVGQSGLYNALSQASLQVQDVQVGADGRASVSLSGQLLLGGECDDPRVKAQIEQTALGIPGVKSVSVKVNGVPLDELLSGKGSEPAAPTNTPSGQSIPHTVQIFLIALEDKGVSGKAVGCGDSVVPVEVQVAPPADASAALKAAFDALLTAGDRYAGGPGLYNSLKNSSLKVEGAAILDGVASVQLSGSLNLGGTCDNPRAAAQLEETARQFAGVRLAAISVNGAPLQDVLSSK